MRLGKFINSMGYSNIENHLRMILISKQKDEYGDETFINLKTDVATVCRYYNNKISDICAEGETISLFIHQ